MIKGSFPWAQRSSEVPGQSQVPGYPTQRGNPHRRYPQGCSRWSSAPGARGHPTPEVRCGSSPGHLTDWGGSLPNSMGLITWFRGRTFGDCARLIIRYSGVEWKLGNREIKVVWVASSLGKQSTKRIKQASCWSVHPISAVWLVSCLNTILYSFPGWGTPLFCMHMCVWGSNCQQGEWDLRPETLLHTSLKSRHFR